MARTTGVWEKMEKQGCRYWGVLLGVGIALIQLASAHGIPPLKSSLPRSEVVRHRPAFRPGEVIVTLKSGTRVTHCQTAFCRLQQTHGLREVEHGQHGTQSIMSPQVRVFRTDGNPTYVCRRLCQDPEVNYAQPNYIYHLCRAPNDPEFPDQYAHQLIRMEQAWDISTGSRDIVVAILDTGVDVNHPDLAENIWTNAGEIPNNDLDDDGNGYVDDVHGWNFDDKDNQISPDAESFSIHSHGTQVAGVIAGLGNNGQGVCGVNWQVSVMALRLSIDLTSKEIASALDYAVANGARVVNMSFSGDGFGPEGDPLVKDAIDRAFSRGVLLVASAGNADTLKPTFPAAYYNVMAVASTNGEDMKTGHSSFGNWVDIAAPGTDIVTTNLNNAYIATAGTSFSSPYVAAVAALVLSYRPHLTPPALRAVLENTTDPIDYGEVDAHAGYAGTGRVNAYQALDTADRGHPWGEIIRPAPQQTFAADGNDIPIALIVNRDTYDLAYRAVGGEDWILIDTGGSAADPNGFVRFAWPRPAQGTYELRLRVTAGRLTHRDRKTFATAWASDQASWPLPQDVSHPAEEVFFGSPLCLDVNGDQRHDIVQASVLLGRDATEGWVSIWDENAKALPGWPQTMGTSWPVYLALGDIDGDSDYEIIAIDDVDGKIFAWHAESGALVQGQWPLLLENQNGIVAACPVLADLDGDGDSEIIVALDEDSRITDSLYAIQGNGRFLWQRRYTSEGPLSVADVDRDGDVEIALCGYGPGMSRIYTYLLDHQGQTLHKWQGGSSLGTVFTDLDSNGQTELLFCAESRVHAVQTDGDVLWASRAFDALDAAGAFSVGDLNYDRFQEIYVNSLVDTDGFMFGRVRGFDHLGRALAGIGFPRTVMGDPSHSPPLIGDVDGDGFKELLVGATGAPLMAWELDGVVTLGFPMPALTPIDSVPLLCDLDQDGDLEMMLASDDYRLHVKDLPAAPFDDSPDWGMHRHDPQNSGWCATAPLLDPIDAPTEVRAGQRLEFQLTTSNPWQLVSRLIAGDLPQGTHLEKKTGLFTWKTTPDQAFQTYRLSFIVTDGVRQHRRVLPVTVAPDAIYHADMNSDPNWTLDEGWAWGAPTGAGSWNGDPTTGRTGEHVLGMALDGDYPNLLTKARHATSPAIDCTGYHEIRLGFWRWLGLESPYDHAWIQVSNDGANWIDLWMSGSFHVSDETWQFVEYALPADIADDQATVYLRWGIGPTDSSVTAPGWNIDDVQITGMRHRAR